jgi:hypothetical protein
VSSAVQQCSARNLSSNKARKIERNVIVIAQEDTTMTQAISTFRLPGKAQYFQELKQTPAVSWPAVGLLLLGLSMIGGASAMALSGGIPLWAAMLINGFGLYLLFTITHESLHRNVTDDSGGTA